MRRSGCSGGEVLGTAVCVLAKHLCGRWQQKGPGVHGPGAGFIQALGLQKDGEQGPSQGNSKGVRLGSPEE